MIDNDIKCFICNKKLKITAINCKCKNFFCKNHFNERDHNCTFNYKLRQKDILEQCMPIIEGKKVQNI